MQLKGSAIAIQSAQKTISAAFANLETSIDAAGKLSSDILATLESKLNILFRIMGQNMADYISKKVKIHQQLQEQYKKKKDMMDEIDKKKELIEVYNNMIHVTESKIKGAKAAMEETKRRSQELSSLNAQIEKTIQDISSTYGVLETRTSSQGSFKNSYIIPNPNRDIQKQFYEAIIKERVVRIEANKAEENKKQVLHDELSTSLSEYQAKYEVSRISIIEHEKTFRQNMDGIEREINSLNKQLEDIYLTESKTAAKMGLQGENLDKFLELVTRLKTDINQGTNAYKPLESLLTATKAMVENQILLLQSTNETDVYVAGAQLLMKVGWLKEYHTASCEQLETSAEYKAITTLHTTGAIEMSHK
ncbi:unnamed protein product [Rotaria socialis]|uniref:Uncharacterized protein n=3 Tax=Rotaria socialis TaxID=392032 RepID=A0A818Q385_9BILA|nr:unnamed protein product [Rotaria socialis]